MFLIIYTFKLYFFISRPFQLCCRCVMSWILFHITCTHIYDTTNIITALQITLILRNTIMGGVRLQILTKKKKLKSFFSFLLFKWHHILHCCPYSFSLLYFNHIFLFVLHFNYLLLRKKREHHRKIKRKKSSRFATFQPKKAMVSMSLSLIKKNIIEMVWLLNDVEKNYIEIFLFDF